MREFDVDAGDGRVLHGYDTGTTDSPDELTLLWHHGTPNIGAPPEPLFAAAAALGIRWIGYDRPGYGGSTPSPGATVASAADDAARIADSIGVDAFAALGHSGGGPRALACGARLADRVRAVVAISSPAPWGADGLDYFVGMSAGGTRELRAAVEGREALTGVLAADEPDPEAFVPADQAALDGDWAWFGGIVSAALAKGRDGMVEDDLGTVAPWGFDLADVTVPMLVVHGTADRLVPSSHGEWLARRCPTAELRLHEGEGHISVLTAAPAALAWVRATAQR